jgi:hypothetical protein
MSGDQLSYGITKGGPAAVGERLAEAAGSSWEDASLYPSHTKTLNWDSLPVREPLPH